MKSQKFIFIISLLVMLSVIIALGGYHAGFNNGYYIAYLENCDEGGILINSNDSYECYYLDEERFELESFDLDVRGVVVDGS